MIGCVCDYDFFIFLVLRSYRDYVNFGEGY